MGDQFVYAVCMQEQMAGGQIRTYSCVLSNDKPITVQNYRLLMDKAAEDAGIQNYVVLNLSILSWPNMTGNKP